MKNEQLKYIEIVDNPPLFDVISEPAQSTTYNTSSIIVFSIIIKIFLILLIIFVARKTAKYFMARMARTKLKGKMNNL